MKLEIFNIKGESTKREADLSEEVFGVQPNDHAIWLDVKRIMAAARQGTHKAKEKGEIAGSTKKLRKQKGIGSARVGSIKSPLFKGGGRVFGPQPRDYDIKVNRKVVRLARRSALTHKMLENKIMVLEDFQVETPKTKEFFSILKNLNISDKKNLVVVSESNSDLYLAARNIPNAYICTPEKLNTYTILNNDLVVLTESAVDVINKTMN